MRQTKRVSNAVGRARDGGRRPETPAFRYSKLPRVGPRRSPPAKTGGTRREFPRAHRPNRRWRTWWFPSAAATLLGTIIAVVHYVSTQKLNRQLESLRQQRRWRRSARGLPGYPRSSRRQPHPSRLASELVETDKQSPADVGSRQANFPRLTETTRALDEIVWTVNPSNDTLDGLITYVCNYAQNTSPWLGCATAWCARPVGRRGDLSGGAAQCVSRVKEGQRSTREASAVDPVAAGGHSVDVGDRTTAQPSGCG